MNTKQACEIIAKHYSAAKANRISIFKSLEHDTQRTCEGGFSCDQCGKFITLPYFFLYFIRYEHLFGMLDVYCYKCIKKGFSNFYHKQLRFPSLRCDGDSFYIYTRKSEKSNQTIKIPALYYVNETSAKMMKETL
ncbi:MAG TPA: hypothetical protein VLE02_02010 [Nitrosarchaeum sp.]|nr:hypothetical protein [Nitrosarchaeum sp.]